MAFWLKSKPISRTIFYNIYFFSVASNVPHSRILPLAWVCGRALRQNAVECIVSGVFFILQFFNIMAHTILVETFLGQNTSFPGTNDNPMRPILYKHPVTGEEHQAHYNDRNLLTDKEYKEAGFEYVTRHGWCYPVSVETLPVTQQGRHFRV